MILANTTTLTYDQVSCRDPTGAHGRCCLGISVADFCGRIDSPYVAEDFAQNQGWMITVVLVTE